MKIVCGACSAKYSVADEKVTGRSVKIRCKKCSETTVVRGETMPGAEAGAWHVVVAGAQRGPMPPHAIGLLIADGTVSWDAYVWRDGFAEWRAAEDVQELVDAIMGEAAPARAAATDLFAAESQSAFAADRPSADDDRVITPSSGHTARAGAMTGARNESSMLFSLENLSALGSSGVNRSASALASATPRAMASGDGSGLIDIRALASATGLGSASSSVPRASAKADDLLGLGAPSLGLGSALGAPVLIAQAPENRRSGSALIVAAAILAVGMLGGASALAYVSVGQNARPAPIAPSVAPIASAPIVTPPETTSSVVVAPVVVATVETPIVVETPPSTSPPTRPTPRRPPPLVTTRPITGEVRPVTREERGLGQMIEDAVGDHRHEPVLTTADHTPDPSLPAAPARSDVMSAMTRVSPAVTACGGGEHGVASVQITIGSNGHVSNAVVGGTFAGTPVGSCIARAVRTATVSPFSRTTFSLTYPFRI